MLYYNVWHVPDHLLPTWRETTVADAREKGINLCSHTFWVFLHLIRASYVTFKHILRELGKACTLSLQLVLYLDYLKLGRTLAMGTRRMHMNL